MTGLLISVKNAEEARMVLPCRPNVIDLKNPEAGSLGRPQLATATKFRHACLERPVQHQEYDQSEPCLQPQRIATSIALGELKDAGEWIGNDNWHFELVRYDYCKVGLSEMACNPSWPDQWRHLQRLVRPCQLVLVSYLDFDAAQAPHPVQTIRFAADNHCSTILFDTFDKSVGNLFEICNDSKLGSYLELAAKEKIKSVIAGSISTKCLKQAISLHPDLIGIRGAICSQSRESSISSRALSKFNLEFQSAICGTKQHY